jgi:membrane fusion protein
MSDAINPLFRREVLDARRQSWLGAISLSQPLRWWVLTSVAIAMATTVVCLLFFGTYTQRSTVGGLLVPNLGLSSVVAPGNGVVARLLADEGAQVRAGQPLALIDLPRSTADGTDALDALREGLRARRDSTRAQGDAQARQIDAQITGAKQQIQGARKELAQIETELVTRRELERIGHETEQRYESVAAKQYISQVQLSQQRQSVLDLVNARQELERQAIQLRRNIAQMEQSLQELPMQRRSLVAGTEGQIASLEQERVQQEASGQLLLKAPVAGLVANRMIEPGQAVASGQVLLSLLPKGSRLQAQLLVPSRAIGFIAPGDEVRLRYQAYPYQKFGHHLGRVLRISRSAITPPNASAGADQVYRVLVELKQQSILAYGKQEALRPGMLLEADILGERRRLYEWVLEPLYSLKGKVDGS